MCVCRLRAMLARLLTAWRYACLSRVALAAASLYVALAADCTAETPVAQMSDRASTPRKGPATFSGDIERPDACSLFTSAANSADMSAGYAFGALTASFSPCGRHVALCRGKTVVLMDSRTGKLAKSVGTHERDTCSATYSPDGKLLAVTTETRTAFEAINAGGVLFSKLRPSVRDSGALFQIYLWQVDDGNLRAVLRGHTSAVARCVFSADSGRLLTIGTELRTRLWNTATGQLLDTFETGHRWSKGGFSDDARWAAFVGAGREIATAQPEALVARAPDGAYGVAYPYAVHLKGYSTPVAAAFDVSPDGVFASTAVFALNNPDFWTEWEAEHPPSEKLRSTTRNGWFIESPLSLVDPHVRGLGAFSRQVRILDRTGAYYSCPLFSPDGKHLAVARSGGKEGELTLWDPATGKLVFVQPSEDWRNWAYAFSPNGRVLAYRGVSLGFLDVARLSWIKTSSRISVSTSASSIPFQFSPDGRLFLGISDKGRVAVWNLEDVFPPKARHLLAAENELQPRENTTTTAPK